MTSLAPRNDPQPPAVPMPPLPPLLANVLPAVAGDKLREAAAILAGAAAFVDWIQQCYPTSRCDICWQQVDTRLYADHVRGHGWADRAAAWLRGGPR